MLETEIFFAVVWRCVENLSRRIMETKNCFPVDNSEMFFPQPEGSSLVKLYIIFFLMLGIFFIKILVIIKKINRQNIF